MQASIQKTLFETGATLMYSAVGSCVNGLNDKSRQLIEIEKDLEKICSWSSYDKYREDMLNAKCLGIFVDFLTHEGRKRNEKMQEYICITLANLAQDITAAVKMATCKDWDCLSYRHNCPLFWLLYLMEDGKTPGIQSSCGAGVLNLSVFVEGKLHIQSLSGIAILLRVLRTNAQEQLVIYAAGILWNMLKLPDIVLNMETRYAVLKIQLDKEISKVLMSQVAELDFVVTKDNIIDPLEDNLQLSLAVLVDIFANVVFRARYFDHPRLTSRLKGVPVEEAKAEKKVRLDADGQILTDYCDVCERWCSTAALYCVSEECKICYHVECSRWKALTKTEMDPDLFYCNNCVVNEYVCLSDLLVRLLQQKQPLKSLFSMKQWKKIQLLRNDATLQQTYMIFTPQDHLLGLAELIFYVEGTTESFLILRLTHQVTKACVMWQQDKVWPLDFSWTFTFCGEKRSSSEKSNLQLGNLFLWAEKFTKPIHPELCRMKSIRQLEHACMYQFTTEFEEKHFSFGDRPGISTCHTSGLLWGNFYPSQTKCAKALMDVLRQKKTLVDPKKKDKKKKITKPQSSVE